MTTTWNALLQRSADDYAEKHMKPMGLTAAMQIVRPTGAQDKIWEAVQEAIREGMSAKDFKLEAAEAWEHELRESGRDAVQELTGTRPRSW